MKPAIVVAAYNRPGALRRLLGSIESGLYPVSVPLIISVDFGGSRRDEVLKVARSFRWTGGKKEIIEHDSHLGITRHMMFVASLTEKFGSVIRLEDDHYVSPVFYTYVSKALKYYAGDDRIAGISLYNIWFNGITKEPFIPYPDEGDVYFLQSPWSHGQAFLNSQWESYLRWYTESDIAVSRGDLLHEGWAALDDEDWFKPFAKYLVEKDRYFVFPRQSVCTNFGDAGAHFKKSSRYFQDTLNSRKSNFLFQELDDCVAVYDSFQELLPAKLSQLTHELQGYDFEMDLNGTKSQPKIRHKYIITSRSARNSIRTWGLELYPREANIVEGIPGTALKLCEADDLRLDGYANVIAKYRQYEYARARLSVGLAGHVLFWLISQVEKAIRLIRRLVE